MSTPVRGADGPLGYAPRWARTAESGRADTVRDAKRRTPTPVQESPQDFRSPLVVMSVRETISPQEMVPFEHAGSGPEVAAAREPASLYTVKTSIFAAVRRLVSVMILAAAGALGFLWLTAPRAPPQLASNPGGGEVTSPASYPPLKPPPATVPPSAAPMANYTRDATDGVNAPPAAPAIPAAPRAPASRVTVPPPTTPAAAAPTPAHAAAAAPPFPAPPTPAFRAAVPAVTAPVALPPPPVAASDHNEVAGLLARGHAYLSEGDVALARLYLRRAAERYDPQAAFALGGTYDPAELRRIGVANFQAHADMAKAREWYRRAADLGSAAAALRLQRLP
jgi:hypothetical protein